MPQTRVSTASYDPRPHFRRSRDRTQKSRKPLLRRVAAKGLVIFSVLILPAVLGVTLAFRENEPGTWAVMVGLPVAAGLAGFGLGRWHIRRERNPREKGEEPE